jgi:hypothetical protein
MACMRTGLMGAGTRRSTRAGGRRPRAEPRPWLARTQASSASVFGRRYPARDCAPPRCGVQSKAFEFFTSQTGQRRKLLAFPRDHPLKQRTSWAGEGRELVRGARRDGTGAANHERDWAAEKTTAPPGDSDLDRGSHMALSCRVPSEYGPTIFIRVRSLEPVP